MQYLIYLGLYVTTLLGIYLGLKYFFPKAWDKVKNFYVIVFSYILKGYRKVLGFNRKLIERIKNEYKEGYKILAVIYGVLYGLLLLIQLLLGLAVLASYILCKITGICIFI